MSGSACRYQLRRSDVQCLFVRVPRRARRSGRASRRIRVRCRCSWRSRDRRSATDACATPHGSPKDGQVHQDDARAVLHLGDHATHRVARPSFASEQESQGNDTESPKPTRQQTAQKERFRRVDSLRQVARAAGRDGRQPGPTPHGFALFCVLRHQGSGEGLRSRRVQLGRERGRPDRVRLSLRLRHLLAVQRCHSPPWRPREESMLPPLTPPTGQPRTGSARRICRRPCRSETGPLATQRTSHVSESRP